MLITIDVVVINFKLADFWSVTGKTFRVDLIHLECEGLSKQDIRNDIYEKKIFI
jgi:hypothetical protein